MKIKVGVIYGGPTVEHEVSIISAVQAMESMDREKYDVIPIYISKDRTWYSGQMLTDIEVYKDFNSLKRYAKKVNLINKDGIFYLQSSTGMSFSFKTHLQTYLSIPTAEDITSQPTYGRLNIFKNP